MAIFNTKTMSLKAPSTTSFFGSIKNSLKSVSRAFQIPEWVFEVDYQKPYYQQTAEQTFRRLRESPWTTACVSLFKRASISITFIAEKWDDEKQDFVRAANHQIEKNIDRPNDTQPFNFFLQSIVEHLLKDGNCVISKTELKLKKKTKFEILDLDGVEPVMDKNEFVRGYNVSVPGLSASGRPLAKYIPKEDIIHIMLPNTDRPEWGISPLECAKSIQSGEALAMQWYGMLMQNGGKLPYGVSTDMTLNAEQRRALAAGIKEDISGDRLGSIPVFTHGLKPVNLGKDPKDMDAQSMSMLDMLRICAILGVPPMLLGGSQFTNNGSLEQNWRMFYTHSVLPLLTVICEAFSMFWIDGAFNKGKEEYRLSLDLSKASGLKEDIMDKAEIIQSLRNQGYSMNQLNASLKLGLPDNGPWGDIRIINGVVIDWAGIEPDYGHTENPHNLGDARTQKPSDDLGPQADQGEARLQPLKSRKAMSEPELKKLYVDIEKDRKLLSDAHQARALDQIATDLKEISDLPVSSSNFETSLENWGKKSQRDWNRIVSRIWTDSATLFANSFNERYKVPKKSREYKATLDGEALDYIKSVAAKHAEFIYDTTSHWIIEFVNQSLLKGLTEEQIQDGIRRKIPELSKFRAAVIVENEVLAGGNFGNRLGAEKSGVFTLKTWRTQRDNKVRASHARMEGETKLLSQRYTNELRYPCDPEGNPEETINCRCFESYD